MNLSRSRSRSGIPLQPLRQRVGECVGRERAGEESGERHADLDRGQKTSRIRRKRTEDPAAFAVLRQLLERDGFQRNQGGLGSREKCIAQDQDGKKDEMQYQGGIRGFRFRFMGSRSRAGQNNKIQENGGKSSFFLDFSEKWLIVL